MVPGPRAPWRRPPFSPLARSRRAGRGQPRGCLSRTLDRAAVPALETSPEIGRPLDDQPEPLELRIRSGEAGHMTLYRCVPAKETVFVLREAAARDCAGSNNRLPRQGPAWGDVAHIVLDELKGLTALLRSIASSPIRSRSSTSAETARRIGCHLIHKMGVGLDPSDSRCATSTFWTCGSGAASRCRRETSAEDRCVTALPKPQRVRVEQRLAGPRRLGSVLFRIRTQ